MRQNDDGVDVEHDGECDNSDDGDVDSDGGENDNAYLRITNFRRYYILYHSTSKTGWKIIFEEWALFHIRNQIHSTLLRSPVGNAVDIAGYSIRFRSVQS